MISFHFRSQSRKCSEAEIGSRSRFFSVLESESDTNRFRGWSGESETEGVVFFSLSKSESKMFRNQSRTQDLELKVFRNQSWCQELKSNSFGSRSRINSGVRVGSRSRESESI